MVGEKSKLKFLRGGKYDSKKRDKRQSAVKTGKQEPTSYHQSDFQMDELSQPIGVTIRSFLSLASLIILTIISAVFILALVISLTGCGPAEAREYAPIKNPPELTQYYYLFLAEAYKRGKDITKYPKPTFYFKKIPNQASGSYKTVGLCNMERNVIYIDKESFDYFDAEMREMVVVHELGHCLLQRDHNRKCLKVNNNNECILSGSIMRPNLIHEYFPYAKNREYYLDELFFTNIDRGELR